MLGNAAPSMHYPPIVEFVVVAGELQLGAHIFA